MLMSAISASSPSATNKCDEANKVLNNLLDCVQQCQKRYGGKTELATEFDSCVSALCLGLEAVFLHGLRNKPLESLYNNTLKQVSDIVATSLNLNNDNRSFWPFITKHLTKHERERYELLKHIWTDTGKSRAWIRSSLNERSLERNFHTILSNNQFLHAYYDDWALLCDDEKNSMLPNMAAGLGSILFAINIDRLELNSDSTSQKSRQSRTQLEPIIEAPIRENKNHRAKQKRKVAKQIISFDEDSDLSSVNLPSVSNNISIDDSSTLSCIMNKDRGQVVEKFHNKDGMRKDVKKILQESGSYDKYNANIEGSLTPVEQTDVDELMPVVMEEIKNSESPDISDDIIEVPTDVGAILTAVEAKHNEQLAKLQFQVNTVMKENDSLKQQLKKYISAVQMLGYDNIGTQDDTTDEVKNLHLPDYKSEAKVFERKLVQVAEMHAELMDFNVQLQQSLCQKDSLLEKLTKELEELRGPISYSGNDVCHTYVHVWIPSAFLTGSGADVHHVYQIFLRAGVDEWNIYRRYAQFYALHTDLKKLDPAVAAFDFPPKKSIGKKDSSLVENRRKRLETYLRKVLSHWPELAHCNSRFLLEQHLAFFKDQKPVDNVKNKKSLFPSRSAASSDSSSSHYTGL